MASLAQQIAAIASSFAGGWFLHVLKVRREDKTARQQRKTTLLAFVNVWADDVAYHMGLIIVGLPPGVYVSKVTSERHSKCQELIAKATELECDYRGENLIRFQSFVNRVTLLKADTNNKAGQKELLTALRDLADFLRKS